MLVYHYSLFLGNYFVLNKPGYVFNFSMRVIWKASYSSQERFIGRIFYCPNKFDANVPK